MTSSKKKIKIFIFSSVHRWNDTRILYKQATSLVKKYDVELHASAMFKHKKINGIDVFGLPQWYKVSERKKTREELWSRVKQSDADIFHFHDPELLWMGIKIRILLKKEVIYDIHEDYEKAILSKNWIPKYFRYLLSKLFYYFEQISVMVIKNIISTTNPISNKFKSLSLNKTIIFNFPFTSTIEPDIQKKDENLVIYVGGITEIRGFSEILDAFSLLEKNKFKFLVIGPISKNYQKKLENKVKYLNLTNKIEFTGLLHYDDIFQYIKKATVGLLCYLPVPNHFVTFPNKIFEYISVGTPVIASNFPLYRQIVDDANCGMLVDPTNPADIADKIEYALNNPIEMREFGENGYNKIQSKYNWENEENKLLDYYKKILTN